MLDWIKDALAAREIEALRADFDQAKRSLARLAADPSSLRTVSPEAAWRLVHGIEASLAIGVKTLREARRSQGIPAGPLRQAVADMLALALHLEELFRGQVLPLVEREFGPPPKGTRWRVEPPGGT